MKEATRQKLMRTQRRRARLKLPTLRKLPGFEQSLRLLVADERYSLTDIALMFGVSRERMRQLCERLGIVHPDGKQVGLHCQRVWDDAANRFRPVAKSTIRREGERRASVVRRQSRAAAREQRRDRIVAVVKELRATLGRNPGWPEIWAGLGYAPIRNPAASIIGLWGYTGTRETRVVLVEIRERTGLEPMPRGRLSWQDRRAAS